ncbi:hypothetical protein MGG_16984, partial [Pyricularia oryzae 70-15]
TPFTTNVPANVNVLRILQKFFIKTRAYFYFNEDNFDNDANKITYAASFLKGDAFAWFEPTLRNYLDYNKEKNRKIKINRIFDNYNNFEKYFRGIFGNPNEKRTVKRKLMGFTQTKSVFKYTSKFRQITAKLLWGKKALITRFYTGFKKKIKNKLVKKKRPDILAKYMELTDANINTPNRLANIIPRFATDFRDKAEKPRGFNTTNHN